MRQSTFNNNKATLFIVATPIGNLEDFTFRAIDILKKSSIIGCEDTRNTLKLINRYDIKTKLISCHQHNQNNCSEQILENLKQGNIVSLVSDSGYPIISDPGSFIVNKVLESGFNVSVVPGASAFLSALVASNLDTTNFTFLGFLSNKKSSRKSELENLKNKKETLIFYESPHRIKDFLNDVLLKFGNRRACLARELTKKFEEYIRGSLSDILDIINTEDLKGEMVLVVEGCKEIKSYVDEKEIIKSINELIKNGISIKDSITIIAKNFSLNKNYVYNLFHVKQKEV